MKITSKTSLALVFYALFSLSSANVAGQTPSDAPPQLNPIENEDSAVSTTGSEKTQQTTETLQQGGQTEVKVTNRIGTYIVKPNQSVGTSLPGDAQSSSNHAAQWVIKSWGGSKDNEPNTAPPVLQNNPDAD